ncbi:MAG: hypothetical protein RL113_508, partial [Pseudomonadota bacterium]
IVAFVGYVVLVLRHRAFILALPLIGIGAFALWGGLYVVLKKTSIEQKKLMVVSVMLFLAFMYFGNVFDLILRKVMGYLTTGTAEDGLHFYSVIQTVREAGKIPFETFANRISGSQWASLPL